MKLLSRLFALCILATSLVTAPAHAQLGVYANFGAAKINSNTDWIYGSSFGGYLDHGHLLFLSTGVDARGVILGAGSNIKFDAGYVGPRFAVRPHVLPIKPYVEGLVGVGYTQIGTGAAQASATKFSYLAVGGLDYTLVPRIDWRVAEFSYGGLSILNSSVHPKTISTGIVIRLPGVF